MISKSFWKCPRRECKNNPMTISSYQEIINSGVPVCQVHEEIMDYIGETDRRLMDLGNTTYVVEDEGGCYALCPDETALLEFAKGSGWNSLVELELAVSVERDELIGKWFLIIQDRIWIR